jgi:hypothetical protein
MHRCAGREGPSLEPSSQIDEPLLAGGAMFFFEVVEICRRTTWAIFRIEWEVSWGRAT